MAVMPAKTPRDMAIAMPNFSRFFICSFIKKVQGSIARMKSMAAE